MRLGSRKSSLGGTGGCKMSSSGFGSWPNGPPSVNDPSSVFSTFSPYFGRSFFLTGAYIWWRWRVTPVARRSAHDVSYVTRINHESYFSCRRDILWWRWMVTPLAPPNASDVFYHMCHTSYRDFAWQAVEFGDVQMSRFAAGASFGIWWCWSVTFRGSGNIWWCCSVTFRNIWCNLGR